MTDIATFSVGLYPEVKSAAWEESPRQRRRLVREDSAQWSGITPIEGPVHSTEDAARAIQEIMALPSDWDGYGSPSPSSLAAEAAFRVVTALEDGRVPRPHVCPVSGGGIQIEWHVRGRDLEFEIHEGGEVTFLAVSGDESIEGFLPADPTAVRQLVNWLGE